MNIIICFIYEHNNIFYFIFYSSLINVVCTPGMTRIFIFQETIRFKVLDKL